MGNIVHKVVTARSASELNEKVASLIAEGFTPVGSHHVITTHQQNRFSGMQHHDTIFTSEYSQTMTKTSEG